MSVNVKLKDEIGQFRVYEDVDTITVNTDEEGVLATFYLNRGFDTPEQRHNNVLEMKKQLTSSYWTSVTWVDETGQTLELITFKVSGVGTWLVTPTNALCLSDRCYATLTDYGAFVVCYGSVGNNVAAVGVSYTPEPCIFYKLSNEFVSMQYTWTNPENSSRYTATPSTFTKVDNYLFAYYVYSNSPGTYIAIYNMSGVLLTHWFWAEEAFKASPTISSSYFFQFSYITQLSTGRYIFHMGNNSNSTYYTLSVDLTRLAWYTAGPYYTTSMYVGYRPLNDTYGILGTMYGTITTYQDYIWFVNRTTGEFFHTTTKHYFPNLYWNGQSNYYYPWPFFFETDTHWFLTGMFQMGDTNTSSYGKSTGCILKINKSTLELQYFATVASAMLSFYFDESTSRLFYVGYNSHKLHVLNVNDLTETTHNLHSSGTQYHIRRTSRGLVIHSCYTTYSTCMNNMMTYNAWKEETYDASGRHITCNNTGYSPRRPIWGMTYGNISAYQTDQAYGAYFFDLVTNTFHTIINTAGMYNVCTELGNCLVFGSTYSYNYSAAFAGFYYFDQVTHTVYQPTQAFRHSNVRNMGYWWHMPVGKYIIVGSGYRNNWYSYQPNQTSGDGIFVINTETFTYNFFESPVSNNYSYGTFYWWCITSDEALWFRPSSANTSYCVWRIKDGVMTQYTGLNSFGYFFLDTFIHNNKEYIHLDKLYEYSNDVLTPLRETETDSFITLAYGNYFSTADCFDDTYIADYYGLHGTTTGDVLHRKSWKDLFIPLANNSIFVPMYSMSNSSTNAKQVIGYILANDGSITRVFIMHSIAPLLQVIYQNATLHKLFILGQNDSAYSGWLVVDTAENTFEWVAQGGYNIEKPNTVARATFENAPEDAGVWVYYEPVAKFNKWYYDFSTGELTRFTWEDMEEQEEQGQEVNL